MIGRLSWSEYFALCASLVLVFIGWNIHLITFCLREFLLLVALRGAISVDITGY